MKKLKESCDNVNRNVAIYFNSKIKIEMSLERQSQLPTKTNRYWIKELRKTLKFELQNEIIACDVAAFGGVFKRMGDRHCSAC